MRAPVVDYRNFRLKKITSPEYNHLLYLLGWVFYFLMYVLTENLIPEEACHPVECRLDGLIPFCEWFIIPYVLWYFLIAGSLLYFALYDPRSFKKMQTYLIIVQVIAVIIYIVYPTVQYLRVDLNALGRDNFAIRLVALIQSADTPTGVCPSMHCAFSMGILSVWARKKEVSRLLRVGIAVLCFVICAATCFVKQHSAVDFFAALPLCLVAELAAFGGDYLKKLKKA